MKHHPTRDVIKRQRVSPVFTTNGVVTVASAALVRALISREMAIAILCTLPITIFRSWLVKHALDRGVAPVRVVLRVFLRTGLSLSALAIGGILGTDIMIGVLMGLGMELITYLITGTRIGRTVR